VSCSDVESGLEVLPKAQHGAPRGLRDMVLGQQSGEADKWTDLTDAKFHSITRPPPEEEEEGELEIANNQL